jgi:hypothetical protein
MLTVGRESKKNSGTAMAEPTKPVILGKTEIEGKEGAVGASQDLTPSKAAPDRLGFHLKEYDFLQKEHLALVEHTHKLEVYAVGGLAAFYAWFIEHGPPRSALWIPILLSSLGAFRSWAVLVRLREIRVYLREIESLFAPGDCEPKGWERHRENSRLSPFVWTSVVFWGVLVIVSVASARLPLR